MDAGNCITVSPIDGSSFYQEDDFLGRGGAGSSIILLYNPNLNLYNGYFIATVIRTVCRKYVYSDMANKDTIGAEKIKLPVDETGNFHIWNYISKIWNLQSAKKSDISGTLDTSSWKLFQISELFNVQKGKRLTKADMKDGKIRLYAFIDKWKKDMQKSKIPLPVDKDGNPDYKYMENHIVNKFDMIKIYLTNLVTSI